MQWYGTQGTMKCTLCVRTFFRRRRPLDLPIIWTICWRIDATDFFFVCGQSAGADDCCIHHIRHWCRVAVVRMHHAPLANRISHFFPSFSFVCWEKLGRIHAWVQQWCSRVSSCLSICGESPVLFMLLCVWWSCGTIWSQQDAPLLFSFHFCYVGDCISIRPCVLLVCSRRCSRIEMHQLTTHTHTIYKQITRSRWIKMSHRPVCLFVFIFFHSFGVMFSRVLVAFRFLRDNNVRLVLLWRLMEKFHATTCAVRFWYSNKRRQ